MPANVALKVSAFLSDDALSRRSQTQLGRNSCRPFFLDTPVCGIRKQIVKTAIRQNHRIFRHLLIAQLFAGSLRTDLGLLAVKRIRQQPFIPDRFRKAKFSQANRQAKFRLRELTWDYWARQRHGPNPILLGPWKLYQDQEQSKNPQAPNSTRGRMLPNPNRSLITHAVR